jgi:predicted RNase H-like HicB family nuclease
MNLKVVIERGEDGYFVVHCPSLKSCWSQGRTRDEAVEKIKEAIALYLEPNSTELIQDEKHEVLDLTL